MRIYCIEKKNLRSIIIYIFVPFFSITYCDQNYVQMINHQINDKKKRVCFCSLFSPFFFKHFRPRPRQFDYFHMKPSDGFSFQGFCGLSLKPPWRKVQKASGFGSVHPTGWFRVKKADSYKKVCQYKSISEFVQICTLRPSPPYRRVNFWSQKFEDL